MGARILAVVDFFDHLMHGQIINYAMSAREAGVLVRARRDRQFDGGVVDVFLRVYESPAQAADLACVLCTGDLKAGMVLASNLTTVHGQTLLAAGSRLTESLIKGLRKVEMRDGHALDVKVQSEI